MSRDVTYAAPNLGAAMYRVFEDRMLVLSESEAFAHHVHCFMRNLQAEEADPTMRIAVFLSPSGSNGKSRRVQIVCPELSYARNERLGLDAWVAFRRLFMRLALDHHRPFYVMHASSVADDQGRAALVVGVSDAGKTSTMIGLLDRGYRMVCDDYSLIGFDDGHVVALPVGCTVTEKMFNLLPQLEPLAREECQFWLQDMYQWTINPSDLYPTLPAYETVEPTHFFFLYPNHGGESSIEECNGEWALWWLHTGRLQSKSVTPRFAASTLDYHQRSFELARSLVRKAKFYKVMNGQLHDTVSMIDQAFRG